MSIVDSDVDFTLDHISLDFEVREIKKTRETNFPAPEVYYRGISDTDIHMWKTDIFDFVASTFGIVYLGKSKIPSHSKWIIYGLGNEKLRVFFV